MRKRSLFVYTLRVLMNNAKVDPKLRRKSKVKLSIRNCIGYKCVCVYVVGCRIVALKRWCLYFLPDTSESTSGLEKTMESPRLVHRVHGPWHGLLVSILIGPICTKLVRMWNRLRIPCELMPMKPPSPVFNVEQDGRCFTVVSAISE